MSIYICPKGHESTESDYCSECGAKINGNSQQVSVLPEKTAQNVVSCPDCSAPHDPKSGDFCEICGYNFVSGAHGEVPPIAVREEEKAIAPLQAEESSVEQASRLSSPIPSLEIVITIDSSLRAEDSPEAPINQEPIVLTLDKESNLIGRCSNIRGIYPEIPLDFDDAVSHRHALLNRQPDGTFILRDIGSTNGTKLNGVELVAMTDAPIKDGDEFTLGHWTRIKVRPNN